jgi:hypothetical protein
LGTMVTLGVGGTDWYSPTHPAGALHWPPEAHQGLQVLKSWAILSPTSERQLPERKRVDFRKDESVSAPQSQACSGDVSSPAGGEEGAFPGGARVSHHQ